MPPSPILPLKRKKRRKLRMRIDENEEGDDSEVWKKYWEQVGESEGFDIVDVPKNRTKGRRLFGLIVPQTSIFRDPSYFKMLSKYAELAIIQYNCDNYVDYEFISLEYANASIDGGVLYYLTIKVKNREAVGDGYQLFQARVWREVGKVKVNFCRPKPKPKKPESSVTGFSSKPIS